MKIGTIAKFNTPDMEEKLASVRDLGFDVCQLTAWYPELFTEKNAKKINDACEKTGVGISTFWCGWSGPAIWNFVEGPTSLGIVPPEYRDDRIKDLCRGSDFAKLLGVTQVATHMGFLPENITDPEFRPVLLAMKQVADHCKRNGQKLLFETGQESPVTLLRYIEESGCDNLGINLDPANLILYGKGNPVDAVEVFGKYVCDVHAKDGLYPTNGRSLGKETPLGQGRVNFPALIKALKNVGYDGTLIIEREIQGEEQRRDILMAKELLEALI